MPTWKILTLNCWGVPFPLASKFRKERIPAIAEELAKGHYDIVILQEVWAKFDYETLRNKVTTTMPYSHYFYSGMIGSGLCVFSKMPILETMFYRFHLNGYAHKIQHGDWFGGKGIGLCQIDCDGVAVNLYTTHIHAEYDRDKDEYLAHRIAQAFEVSQFVKFTSRTCDVVIIGGDLNLEPEDLGFKIIKSNSNMCDAWLEQQHKKPEQLGSTDESPTNYFTKPSVKASRPHGKRIDYILYRANPGTTVEIEDCRVALGKIPNRDFNYSDHEAVSAIITVHRGKGSGTKAKVTPDKTTLLRKAQIFIDRGLKKTERDGRFFLGVAIACVFILYFFSAIQLPYGLNWLMAFLKVSLTLAVGFSVWSMVVIYKVEESGLIACRNDIENLLKAEALQQDITENMKIS